MKKLLSVLLAILIAFTIVPLSVSAEDILNHYISDVKEYYSDTGELIGIEYYSEDDKTTYKVEINGEDINVTDLQTGKVLTAELSNSNHNLQNILPIPAGSSTMATDYDVWPSYYTKVGSAEVHFDSISAWTVSAILGLLVTCVTKDLNLAVQIGGAVYSSLYSLATTIYSNRYDGTILEKWVMFNVYCTTLARYRYQYWTTDGIFIDMYTEEKWLLDPYDPMSAYACKVLAGIY